MVNEETGERRVLHGPQLRLLQAMGVELWQQRVDLPGFALAQSWFNRPDLAVRPVPHLQTEREQTQGGRASIKELQVLLQSVTATVADETQSRRQTRSVELPVHTVNSPLVPEYAIYLQPLTTNWLLLFRTAIGESPAPTLLLWLQALSKWLAPAEAFVCAKPFLLKSHLPGESGLNVAVAQQALQALCRRFERYPFMLVFEEELQEFLDPEWQQRSAVIPLTCSGVRAAQYADDKKLIYRVVVQCLLSGK